MNIVKQGFEVWTDISDEDAILYELARSASICYQSEDKLNDKEYVRRLISSILKRGHNSVFRQFFIKVKITSDIVVIRQLIRHTPQYPLEQSSRLCNYSKDKFNNEITIIHDNDFIPGTRAYKLWYDACKHCEEAYFGILEEGFKPEKARKVLTMSTKSAYILYTHIDKWREILRVRTAKDVQPETREMANDILKEFKEKLPLLFGDI